LDGKNISDGKWGVSLIQLFRVVAPSRSGTKWFSQVLTTENSFCFHELSTHIHPFPSNVAFENWILENTEALDFEERQRRAILQIYPRYFSLLFERLRYGQEIIGNSEGSTRMVTGLQILWPSMRFLFSVRNGINAVQSLVSVDTELPATLISYLEERYETRNIFRLMCHQWRASIEGIEESIRVLDNKADFLMVKFENITSNLEDLQKAWQWIGIPKWADYEERNKLMMQTPINARTNRNKKVSPKEIWGVWTSEQRDMFLEICGEAMKRMDYRIPN
jgi:hypothetical protein